MTYKANYFDGKSSKTYVATIQTSGNNWKIICIDDLDISKEIIWDINKIQRSEVYTKGLVSFTYGNSFPFQKIESRDVNFINYISNSEHRNINNKVDTFLHKSIKKSIVIILLLIISFSASMYFYVIPKIAINFVKNIPNHNVIEFGNYVFKTVSADLDIDEQQSQKLQSFVDALSLNSDFPIKAYVAKNNQLNAFALSGGKFVIYNALLNKLENEHQLTALIGHEVSHIQNRHVLKNISRDLSGALFMSILFGDVNGVTSIITENAHLFSQLSYTRNLEKEADIFGLEIMRKNDLDLHGMPELFEILNTNHKIDVPSFLSSHPMLDDRITYTKEIADKQKEITPNLLIKDKWEDLKNSL